MFSGQGAGFEPRPFSSELQARAGREYPTAEKPEF